MASISIETNSFPHLGPTHTDQHCMHNSGSFGQVKTTDEITLVSQPFLSLDETTPASVRSSIPILQQSNSDGTTIAVNRAHRAAVVLSFVDSEKADPAEPVIPTTQISNSPSWTLAHAKVPASTRLQDMLHGSQRLIVCPGVYDGLSARTAIEVGFDALYMTGAGTAASRLGMADLGLATLSDMRAHAEMICNLKPNGPPLIADMDTGYGGAMMVYRCVCEYIRAGVAGFHLEDQVLTKRCGHLRGKAVVPREEYYTRIRAAVLAKQHTGSDIVLIARTDALQQCGYEECIERLKAARQLGADVGLLEGFTSKEQARKCVQEFPGWPLMLNSVENGASPLITVDEARDMGFRIMIFSFASLAPAYQAIRATFQKLKAEGIIGTKEAITPKKIFEVCGLDDLMDVDLGAGSTSFLSGV